MAEAQSRRGESALASSGGVRLSSAVDNINLLPYLNIYKDPQFRLSMVDILERHEVGVGGDVKAEETLNFSFSNAAYWAVFKVKNETDSENWLLDFGRITTGKIGLPRKLILYNATKGEAVFDSEEGVSQGGETSAVLLKIKPRSTQEFVMYVQPSDSMGLSFPLNIRSALSGFEESQFTFLSEAYFFMILGGGIVFLIGVSLFRGGWIFLPLVFLFIVRTAWYWFQNNFVSLPPIMLDWVSVFYMMLSCMAAIFSTWFFANINKKEGEGALLLIIVSSALFFGFVLFAFVLPENTILRTVALYVPYFVTFLSLAFYGFGQGNAGVHGARNLGIAWLIWVAAFSVHLLASAEILPKSVFLLQADWFGMGGVLLFFIFAVSDRLEGMKQQAVRVIIRKAQKAQSVAKLKQSKESADQARLLRVIEREREIMEELRQREAQRTEEMRLAKIGADDANSAKSAFLAVVSHEIRTPMTGILGMLRLLQDTPLTQEQVEYSQTIQDSGEAMMALLNDILDFSKIEGDAMTLEIVDFDLNRLIQGVIRLMSGHASQKEIYVKAQIDEGVPAFVKGDPTRLRQVLLNLVGNAIKFTSEGGVTLRVSLDETDPRGEDYPNFVPLKFLVEDTGIGISEEGQKNLFTPFAQADSSISRKFGGTGLGLAICKKLIEAMGSIIQLNSVEGQGTKFFFTIFLAHGDAANVASESGARIGDEQGKAVNKSLGILVVDDNEINRKVIQGLLSKGGYKSAVAENAQDAIALSEHHNFDLILMDIELPDMNGVEATKVIRENQKNKPEGTKVPHIAALTGNVDAADVAGYLESGMDSHLAKPIEPEKMFDLVYKLSKELGPEEAQEGETAPAAAEEVTEAPKPSEATTVTADASAQDMAQSAEVAEEAVMPSPANEVPTENQNVTEPQPAPEAKQESSLVENVLSKVDEITEYERQEEEIAQQQGEGKWVDKLKDAVKDMAKGSLGFDLTEEELNESSFDVLDDDDDNEGGYWVDMSEEQQALQQKAQVSEDAPEPAMQAEENSAEPAEKAEASTAPKWSAEEIFDEPMLASLKDSLGVDQLKELIYPLFEKNDELVVAIEQAMADNNLEEIKNRAHELKGMCGNFGLKKLSEIGSVIEKAIRDGETDISALQPSVEQLPEANDASRQILEEWMVQ